MTLIFGFRLRDFIAAAHLLGMSFSTYSRENWYDIHDKALETGLLTEEDRYA